MDTPITPGSMENPFIMALMTTITSCSTIFYSHTSNITALDVGYWIMSWWYILWKCCHYANATRQHILLVPIPDGCVCVPSFSLVFCENELNDIVTGMCSPWVCKLLVHFLVDGFGSIYIFWKWLRSHILLIPYRLWYYYTSSTL